MIPPKLNGPCRNAPVQKLSEVKGSHAIYVSQPRAVASLIEQAAKWFRLNGEVESHLLR